MNKTISKILAIMSVLFGIITTGLSLYGVIVDHRFTKIVYSKNYTKYQVLDVDKIYITSDALNYACDCEKDVKDVKDASVYIYKTRLDILYTLPYTIINPPNLKCNYLLSETINNKMYYTTCDTTYGYCKHTDYVIILFNNTNYNTKYNTKYNTITLNMSSFTVHQTDNIILGINMIFGLPISIIFLIICCTMAFFEPINNRYQKLGNKPRIVSMSNNNDNDNNTNSTDSLESTESTV